MFCHDEMYQGKLKTNSQREWQLPDTGAARAEHELSEQSERSLSSVTEPASRLRLMCLARGAAGVMELGRMFHHIRDDGSQHINKEEFSKAIKATGLDLGEEDSNVLFDSFDFGNNGSINIDEFMKFIRPPMSQTRRSIVEAAFRKLDKAGDGLVTVDEIRKVYSVLSNPRYKSGEESKEHILLQFLSHFEEDGIKDGVVTMDDFMNYYSGISASMDTDCYFDLVMRQDYKL